MNADFLDRFEDVAWRHWWNAYHL